MARPAPRAMFRMWQEREDPTIRVEEIVGESEEITQRLKAGTIKDELIVVESDDEGQEGERESAITILEKMEDLLGKVERHQQKLKSLCDETREWEANLPGVFLYDSGPEPPLGQQGYPRVATVGDDPRSGMTYRPPTSHGRVPQTARTRSQNKAETIQEPGQAPSQAPPRKEPELGRRKEVVEVPEEDEEDEDEEDERLRQEEDRRAELRAKKRGTQEEAEPSLPDSVPKKKKYAVWLEEGFDVERMVDRLLEGHNDLMNLKDILASAPRLRDGLKGRLSQTLVPNVHLSTILPREVEWTEAGRRMDWKCVACGQVDFVVKDQKCIGMVDTGAYRAYAFNDDQRGRLDVDKIPMIRIHTVPQEPWNLRGARYPNPDEEKMVVDYLDGKMRTNVADYSSGPYSYPWFCFIKPNRTLRWVQDLQRLNVVTVRDAGGLPNVNALSESCAGRPIILLIDLYSGYDQFPVYPPDRPVTAMHTPRGLIHMNLALKAGRMHWQWCKGI
ncbi:hypothetical protein CBR_g52268 [Chara braunii]|uniref:Reverse transcriptase domain-containing protein n=1 Tax=Chara braunii TaxID=69332 RepID=A0A388M9X9_CHABU|nr:hypothetical protein CBR_g52268 [Chara braunii]|eukprot:GBG91381.1 hypothetical protein CBR_g52268 [Chara braunii]